jgi:hypothetical protein
VIAQLDESAPARLAKALNAVGCRALRFPNDRKGLKNGELLARLRSNGVSCLITCDKNLQYQQNMADSGLALVVLPRQRFDDLLPLLNKIVAVVGTSLPGQVISIELDGTSRKAL